MLLVKLWAGRLAHELLGAMFLGSLSDVFGRRKVILYGLMVVGLSVLATAYVNSIGLLIALRFISGLGAGAMLASQATLASEFGWRSMFVAGGAVTLGLWFVAYCCQSRYSFIK